ncbi:hypothetical protein [Candidatus Borrarchaeum sp.]|uniref:hypothetical protein n=1 Tax=Candidatus Borrarchaeum sp. TaxID=2846742 RepID=UPI00257C73C5|nr:hypothetical protein [Candidatus Borrarchaeum sp.]
MNKREVPFEYVRLAGKAPIQVSQHEKDGVSEGYIKRRVLYSSIKEREYLPDGSFRLILKFKKGHRKPFLVEIFVREKTYNNLIREFIVYGVHVTKE